MPLDNELEVIEKSPMGMWMKATISTLTGVVAILGAMWALDSHYATAANLNSLRYSVNSQFVQLRYQTLSDKIFELDMKKQTQHGKLSPLDQALLDRYTEEQKDVRRQLRSMTQPIVQ